MDLKTEVQLSLKKRRESLGLTQEEMARMIGVSLNTISEWESCTKIINSIDVLNVLKAYKSDLKDIICYLKFAMQYSQLK